MQNVKRIIKRTGSDFKINFTLSGNKVLNGLQQSIDDFVEAETGLSINPVDDVDTFRHLPVDDDIYNYYFYSADTMSWGNSYEYAGFTTGETNSKAESVLRSFFIIQLYDKPDVVNQTLLNNGYHNGFSFIDDNNGGNSLVPTYTGNSDLEYTNFYISNTFIESLSGVTTTLYGKISFYNAKTGKLAPFYPSDTINPQTIDSPTGDTGIYVEYQLNPTGKTYTMTAVTRLKEFANQDYIDKLNNSLDSFDNLKTVYPTGNTFLNTGKYVVNV